MRREGSLWENLISIKNILEAYKKAKKGTKSKEALIFHFNLENEIIELLEELESGNYMPSSYRYFKIHDPKERIIAVAPFKDRVVHHALVNVLEPVYEKRFIFDSYATRKDKGTHKAVFRAQSFLKKNKWYLKADISKYFPSIDHDILLSILTRKIKDKKVINLASRIIRNGGENGIGIPIGNLTSQFFANVYLDIFDHFIKDELGIKYYVRYMDDFVIFSLKKEYLKELRNNIAGYLKLKLKLSLKEKATYINSRQNGLSFLGARIYPEIIRIRNENLKRSMKKIKIRLNEYNSGKITEQKFLQGMQSIFGLLEKYNTYKLRKKIIGKVS